MPSTRVIAGAALGCLFVFGPFDGQGMAQTASKDPVSKLIRFLHPGEPETKAKHPSKGTGKKAASAKPASKESPSNGAPELTPSDPVIVGEVMRVTSPNDADFDLAAKGQGPAVGDAPSAAAKVVKAVSPETMAAADKSNAGSAVVSLAPSSGIGSLSWLLRVIAALSGAMATGLLAWVLIRPNASAEVWVRLTES
jgi:hypothetical protein